MLTMGEIAPRMRERSAYPGSPCRHCSNARSNRSWCGSGGGPGSEASNMGETWRCAASKHDPAVGGRKGAHGLGCLRRHCKRQRRPRASPEARGRSSKSRSHVAAARGASQVGRQVAPLVAPVEPLAAPGEVAARGEVATPDLGVGVLGVRWQEGKPHTCVTGNSAKSIGGKGRGRGCELFLDRSPIAGGAPIHGQVLGKWGRFSCQKLSVADCRSPVSRL